MIDQRLITDHKYRLEGKWPLVPFSEFPQEEIKNIEYVHTLGVLPGQSPTLLPDVDAAVGGLLSAFPDLEYLIKTYGVIAAGGALYKAVYNMEQKSDIDLYFVGKGDEDVMREIFHYFENKYPGKVKFARNHRVSTIGILLDNNREVIYQFIHRVYPTADKVIGGFDLGVSSILYDGHGIYATPLGAFCVSNRVIIVDPTKHATSYLSRIMKYYYHYYTSIIFPGYGRKQGDYTAEKFRIYYDRWRPCGPIFDLNFSEHDADYDFNIVGLVEQYLDPKFNSIMAIYKQTDLLSWYGTTTEEIFNPKITYKLIDRYNAKYATKNTLTAIFGKEKADNISRKGYHMDEKVNTEIVEYLINHIPKIIEIATVRARDGVQWIMEDSVYFAVNHIKITPQEFYGPQYIDPRAEPYLLHLVKNKIGIFQHLSRDTIKIILKKVYW